ncbi:hypothetical protein PNK_1102 [Candidatus Protochlamydia naegleriophila]|uniref:Outer membrane protein beta-barrel domain-containing protein n=2 Tax=Candidatus Protochlamydia naegleriophila TaxID=389348 RepID=A0A0U5JEA7_9BACT|nr:hypothetical protein PNK_1102 [Candidatus Protochlamydia naegleriophila]
MALEDNERDRKNNLRLTTGFKMKSKTFSFSIFFCLISFFPSLYADCCSNGANQLFIGPEVYYVKRTKKAGAEQDGYLYGVRLGYERIKRYKLYVGLDFLYANGDLKGKVEDQRIKSSLTDINVEERIGYTFAAKCGWRPSFTPFIGVGRFWEKNEYKHPTPIRFHFHNRFLYIPVGFLSQIYVSSCFSVGLNFKARIILDGKNCVSNDPQFGKIHQCYDEKIQYRVELPLSYYSCWCNHEMAISLVPFYEYRHYGQRVNFPFDFIETKFNLYGATLKAIYLF